MPARPHIRPAGILLNFVLILSACAGAQREAWAETSDLREAFDPQTLDDDDFLLQPNEGTTGVLRPGLAGSKPPSPEPPKDISALPGQSRGVSGPVYRVQVAAVNTAERAGEVQKDVEQALGGAVYIQHDPPLYKIQAGDFRTRLEADRFLGVVQGKGYAGAFLVSAGGLQTPGPRASEVPSRKPVPQMTPAQGYRVQVFSVTDRDEAHRFYEEARKRLNREDIYLQFEPPFFRVRVGNCRSRDAAEDLVRELEQAGYEAPFPVRTQILVPETTPSSHE